MALHDAGLMKAVLDRYRSEGYLLVGISNQSGIAKGILSEADAKACFEATRVLFGYGEGDFPILYCPHRAAPPVCYCRKPQSGMLVEACERWHIQPSASLMIGDMKRRHDEWIFLSKILRNFGRMNLRRGKGLNKFNNQADP